MASQANSSNNDEDPVPHATTRLELPDGYYLDHFSDVLHTVKDLYASFLDEDERSFIGDFESLPQGSQRLFVRLLNRKGTVFFRSKLRYPDIDSIDVALEILSGRRFVRDPRPQDFEIVLDALNREQLVQLIGEKARRDEKRDILLEKGRRLGFEAFSMHPLSSDVIVQCHSDVWSYLSFLTFGDLHQNLTLYTLRDLGIRKSNTWQSKKAAPRFGSPREARSEFRLKSYRQDIREIQYRDLPPEVFEPANWPESTGPGAEKEREKLAWDLSTRLAANGRVDEALTILSREQSARAIIKRVRLLHGKGGLAAVREPLEGLIADPPSSEVLLFAEDFWARKFEGRKVGAVTQALRDGLSLVIDARHRGQPERGVRDYYRERGERAYRSENYLWLSLFGILFWEELFQGASAAIHSEFDRLPRDLVEGTFYDRKAAAIEAKLSRILEPETREAILTTIAQHGGARNGVFSWHPSNSVVLAEFLSACSLSKADPARILRALAKDFDRNRKGFPDLLRFNDGRPSFIEVKSSGDSLSRDQLRQMRLLNESGFETGIVRVVWNDSSRQEYVVVDVETTGGSSALDRVTELGAVKVVQGRITDSYATLVNPGKRIPPAIVNLTGITNEMVASAPAFDEIAPRFLEFLGEAIFVGHNVRFDYAFVAAEFRRAGMRFKAPTFCTCSGMRRAYPGLDSYKLANLCGHFAVPLFEHHRALPDARATAELLVLLLQKAEEEAFGPPKE